MPRPFPGMDPYLEDPSVWEEFHHVFITECMYLLAVRLPENYVAKIQERVELISIADEAAARYLPDVAVARDQRSDRGRENPGAARAGAAVAEPVTIPAAESIEVREGHVEILRLPDYELVTSIELLSPWNKYGEGIGEYRHKRRALVGSGVHVVELDLLRRGTRTELANPLPPGDYYALVFRADRRPDVNVWGWNIRAPLPPIPIPLKKPDGEIWLDLGAVVNAVYDHGLYSRKVRYGRPPVPPLSPEDAAWAADLLKAVAKPRD